MIRKPCRTRGVTKHILFSKFWGLGFLIDNAGLSAFNSPEWKNATQYYLIISNQKLQLVLRWKVRELSDSFMRACERGNCVWEPYWPKSPWHNSSLCRNAPWQFIFLQETRKYCGEPAIKLLTGHWNISVPTMNAAQATKQHSQAGN